MTAEKKVRDDCKPARIVSKSARILGPDRGVAQIGIMRGQAHVELVAQATGCAPGWTAHRFAILRGGDFGGLRKDPLLAWLARAERRADPVGGAPVDRDVRHPLPDRLPAAALLASYSELFGVLTGFDNICL